MQLKEKKAINWLVTMLETQDKFAEEIASNDNYTDRKELSRGRNSHWMKYLAVCKAFDIAFDLEPGTMETRSMLAHIHTNH